MWNVSYSIEDVMYIYDSGLTTDKYTHNFIPFSCFIHNSSEVNVIIYFSGRLTADHARNVATCSNEPHTLYLTISTKLYVLPQSFNKEHASMNQCLDR